MAKHEVALVVQFNEGKWFWRIDINGKTTENCKHGYPTFEACVHDLYSSI